jgi:dipeptidyl aminopeptidase/acylaminoacyl peptidase
VVLDAIAAAKRLPWIDGHRVYLYGESRGAVVAAVMVNQVAGIQGAVLRSGAYDLPHLYQETSSWWLKKLLNPKGETNPKLFNILDDVPAWKTPTLILHGTQDWVIPPSQALLLRDRLQASGKTYRLVLFPDRGMAAAARTKPNRGVPRERSGWSCRARAASMATPAGDR